MHSKNYDVFISYSSKDQIWVAKFVQALQACGLSVWWDRSLLAGQSFHKNIQDALDDSSCVVTVWSKNSVSSQWVLAESEQAFKRGVIVPISCNSARISVPFSSLHTIDLSRWNGEINDLCFQQALFPIRQTLRGSVRSKSLDNVRSSKKRGIKRSALFSLILALVAYSMFILSNEWTSVHNDKPSVVVPMSEVTDSAPFDNVAKRFVYLSESISSKLNKITSELNACRGFKDLYINITDASSKFKSKIRKNIRACDSAYRLHWEETLSVETEKISDLSKLYTELGSLAHGSDMEDFQKTLEKVIKSHLIVDNSIRSY